MYVERSARLGATVHLIRADRPLQKVQEHQVREVLKCILHTIIFNRALGHVSPRDMDLQLVNVSYVEVGDEAVERQVNAGLHAVQDFVRALKARAPALSPSVRLLPQTQGCSVWRRLNRLLACLGALLADVSLLAARTLRATFPECASL